MLKMKKVEHFDELEAVTVVYCEIDSNSLSKKLEAKGKEIDGENFSNDCFGFIVHIGNDGICIVENECTCEKIFYIDNTGDKHFLEYSLSKEEEEMLLMNCLEEMKQYLSIDFLYNLLIRTKSDYRSNIVDLDDYIAFKLWSIEDIKDCIAEKGYCFTEEQIDSVARSPYIKHLSECCDSEWEAINSAIEEVRKASV